MQAVFQAYLFQEILRLLPHILLIGIADPSRKHGIFQCREIWQQIIHLKYETDMLVAELLQEPVFLRKNIFTLEKNGSRLRPVQPAPSEVLAGTDSAIGDLPNGAFMRVAIRRSTRVRENAGLPLEDLGVIPDARHDITRNDLLTGNKDLINEAARLLSQA